MTEKTEMFSNKLNNRYNNEYIVLSEYTTQDKKVLVKHIKCNQEFEITPKSFIAKRSKGCNFCRIKSRTKTHDIFINEVKQLVGNEYEVLSQYELSSKKITMRHKDCGNEYEVTPSKFLYGRRCPSCFGNNKRTNDLWKQEVKTLVGDEYSILGEYVNNRTQILMQHNICNHKWEISPSNFKKGHRCPICSIKKIAKKLSLTHEEFVERFNSVNEADYEIISIYKSMSHKIKIKHKSCGNIFETLPNNFLNGNRCPHCKPISRGEQKIKTWLLNNNIEFNSEYTFPDLQGQKNKPLRFDFGIINNNNLSLLLEYDGRQHFIYEESSMFSRESFEATKIRDSIKNKYCIINNITLIRIDYLNYDNIENILTKVILEEDSETIRKFAVHIAN